MLFITISIQFVQQIPYRGAVENFGDLRVGGQVICTVICANDLVSSTEHD
jgi:hypothetical protein